MMEITCANYHNQAAIAAEIRAHNAWWKELGDKSPPVPEGTNHCDQCQGVGTAGPLFKELKPELRRCFKPLSKEQQHAEGQ